MNIQSNINKLLYAIKQNGSDIRLTTLQYWNDNKEKYSTKYIVTEKRLVRNRKNQLVEKYVQIEECYR